MLHTKSSKYIALQRQKFFQNCDTNNFCFYFEKRRPNCNVAVADKKNETCTIGSVQEHLSLELKPDSLVYIQGQLKQENISLSRFETVFVFPSNVIFVTIISLVFAENISAEGRNTARTNLSNGPLHVSTVSTTVHPDCPNEDNYHSTIWGDCYYIPNIHGSLITATWSEAFEFCKENSLNMWIIDSQMEESGVKILWQTVTGGKYNF